MNPAVLMEEPYGLPWEEGSSPRGHDPNTQPDGGVITGSEWNADWRGEAFVGAGYQGYGGPHGQPVSPGGAPTGWDPHTGLVQSSPAIHGYAGPLQEMSMVTLRAGSTIGWPLHGQTEPGFDPTLIWLASEQGTDVGWQLWWTDSQRQLFEEPPTYSEQTDPLAAGGWP